MHVIKRLQNSYLTVLILTALFSLSSLTKVLRKLKMLNTMGCYCWCVFWCLLLKKLKKLKGKFHCFTNNAICVSDTENSKLLWHNTKTDLSISYSQSSLELYIVQLCTLFDCDSLCGKSLQEARNSLKVKRNTLFKQMNLGHN